MLDFLVEAAEFRQGMVPAVGLAPKKFLRDREMNGGLTGRLVLDERGEPRRAAELPAGGEVFRDLHFRVRAAVQAPEQFHDQLIAEAKRRIALLGAETVRGQRRA